MNRQASTPYQIMKFFFREFSVEPGFKRDIHWRDQRHFALCFLKHRDCASGTAIQIFSWLGLGIATFI